MDFYEMDYRLKVMIVIPRQNIIQKITNKNGYRRSAKIPSPRDLKITYLNLQKPNSRNRRNVLDLSRMLQL